MDQQSHPKFYAMEDSFPPDVVSPAPGALLEEQSWLNMPIVSLFIASVGITAVTIAIVAVCASALSIPTAAVIAGAGLASTLVGGIGFFGYSSRNTAVNITAPVPLREQNMESFS
jgi:Flp pilus assembly protein TadB